MAEPSFAEDCALARRAIAEGELKHAAHHLAGAVAIRPSSPEVQDLLARFQEASGARALGLVTLGQEVFHGLAALRAWLLQSSGRTGEAVVLLTRVAAAAPTVPYLPWLGWWLEDDAALAAVDPEALAAAAQAFFSAVPLEAPGEADPNLQALLGLLDRAVEALPSCASLFFVSCVALRRAGRIDAALAMAEARRRTRPDYFTFVALAGLHRHLGRLPEAVEDFRAGLRFQPEDVGARLDIGDLCLELRRLEEALEAYEEALARDPENAWAAPSALYVRYRLNAAPEDRERLWRYAAAHPGNGRAALLAERMEPFVLALPRRPEALVGLAVHVHEGLASGGSLGAVAISSLEAPSAVLALQLALGDKRAGEAEVEFAEIPEPDPRLPLEPVRWTLWRYEGTRARPALAAPPEAILAAVATLAARPYALTAWWDAARLPAHSLGAAALPELLAAIVHPPPRPAERPPWEWLPRVQVAAALILARLDGEWPGPRREALFALALGPVDWAGTAALVALCELARREPAARDDVVALFFRLLDLPSCPVRHQCLHEPIAQLGPRLPGLAREQRARLAQVLATLDP